MWDLSLGKDVGAALERCTALTKHHDGLIAMLSEDAARPEIEQDTNAVMPAANLASMLENEHEELEATWRDTETYLEGARALTPRLEYETLAVFAHQAFGDDGYIAKVDNPTPYMQVARRLPVSPAPDGTDMVETAMYKAMKSVLDVRMTELNGKRPKDPTKTITGRLDQYIAYRAVSESTARGYRMRIARFVDFAGDLTLDEITPAILREHRDRLLKDMGRASVAQYFYPIKSLFNWAIKEEIVADNPAVKIDIPPNDKTVEDTKWQAFKPDEMALIWAGVEEAWGKNGKSRLSAGRRQAFHMAFRVLLWTGMRPNEVFLLDKSQVEPDRIHIKKTKTGAARVIPLAAPIADFYQFMQDDGFAEVNKLDSPSNKMSDLFRKIKTRAGLTNDRQVLYSLKDTLIDRLEALGASENVQRSIIGHVTGRGALRNYKTGAGLDDMRGYLDKVTYCDGM